jgi:methionyl-tRNA synthetase
MTFASRYFDGRVPDLVDPSDDDRSVLEKIAGFRDRIGASYEAFRNREAVFETMGLARLGNKYFNDTEPWHTRNSDMRACGNTIHVSLQICASLAVLMEPVLPFAANSLRRMLSLDGIRSSIPREGQTALQGIGWDEAGGPLLSADHVLGEPEILFRKLDDEVIEAQVAKLKRAETPPVADETPHTPLSEEISYDDFAKLDLRVATVLSAERMPKSRKLLRVELDLGFEKRTVLAGAAEHYEPHALIGKKVVMLANLAPRKMMGVESQGMMLMSEDRDGKLTLVSSNGEDGAVVR